MPRWWQARESLPEADSPAARRAADRKWPRPGARTGCRSGRAGGSRRSRPRSGARTARGGVCRSARRRSFEVARFDLGRTRVTSSRSLPLPGCDGRRQLDWTCNRDTCSSEVGHARLQRELLGPRRGLIRAPGHHQFVVRQRSSDADPEGPGGPGGEVMHDLRAPSRRVKI